MAAVTLPTGFVLAAVGPVLAQADSSTAQATTAGGIKRWNLIWLSRVEIRRHYRQAILEKSCVWSTSLGWHIAHGRR
jgi:hypothetical protein